MSSFESEHTARRHRESGSAADIIAFDGWDEEQRRIARVAVANESGSAEESRFNGRVSMETEANREYDTIARQHRAILAAVKALRPSAQTPIDLTVHVDAIDAVVKLIEALPVELPIGAEE